VRAIRLTDDNAIPTHRSVALIASPASIFDIGCVVEVFDVLREEAVRNSYSLDLASTESATADVAGACIAIQGLKGPEAFEAADTIIIPAYPIGNAPGRGDVEIVRRCYERGTRILSICTGAFLLGAAGILDGRRATTHWRFSELFRSRYPAVKLDPDILYADEGQIVTAAGSVAGIDMLLHVIRSDEGASVCNAVARRPTGDLHGKL